IQFPSVNAEGAYNATLLLLNYPFGSDAPDPSCDLPQLIDYGGTGGGTCATDPDSQPAVWISVVGNGELVPLRSYCGLDTKQNYVYKRKVVRTTPGLPPTSHVITVTAADLGFVLATAMVFIAIASAPMLLNGVRPCMRSAAAAGTITAPAPLTLLA